jgi:acetyl-CoA carboxylase biotin carboxylase subunit
MFQKILIANRGEIALRVMQACRGLGVRTVAVYSDADAQALHVRSADEAYRLGPAPSLESYLRGELIIQMALESGSQAIHPGYGFLSENAAFAEAVRAAGLVFIGPPAEAIRLMGSKTAARARMQAAGVPVVPGYQGTDGDFAAEAAKIGYPILVKAAAGGGGKGMRVVEAPAGLVEAIAGARAEAAKAFGDDTVFMEKYLPVSHHIEFQVLGDSHGNVLHLFERECSIQRRHQKIIEETPSPLLTPAMRAEMGAAAVAAAQAVGYQNAGTIEFIADEAGHFYFLEMNTRLQVEHPITELVTGQDLVRLQLKVAAGEALPFRQADLTQRGHALECRVYAEDPANGFLPSVGPVLLAHEPRMPNIRLDTGAKSGDEISLYYDPMMAKLISYGATREEAIQTMQAALGQYNILGISTNIPFLLAILAHPAFQAGHTTTHFIPQHLPDWAPAPLEQTSLDMAAIAAALFDYLQLGTGGGTPASGRAGGDVYSPWSQADRFRLGE